MKTHWVHVNLAYATKNWREQTLFALLTDTQQGEQSLNNSRKKDLEEDIVEVHVRARRPAAVECVAVPPGVLPRVKVQVPALLRRQAHLAHCSSLLFPSMQIVTKLLCASSRACTNRVHYNSMHAHSKAQKPQKMEQVQGPQ